jgi:signal transduction histidine kinase
MRKRLVVAIAGVAAGAVVLFALPLALALRVTYRDEELLRLQRDTFAATRAIDLDTRTRDPVELPKSSDVLAVYSKDGRRLAGHGPATAPPEVRTVLQTGRPSDKASDGRLIAVVPLVVREQLTGALRAERSDNAAAADTHAAWLLLAAFAATVVGLAVLAALVLGRRLAKPLEQLADTARRIGHGDFAARTPHADIPEVDALGAALETTAGRLDQLVSRERSFSSDASHQLRTPLAALRMELEAMQLSGPSDASVEAALHEVDRLEETIATLLAVARDVPRSGAQTDLVALIDELEGAWRARLAAAGRPFRSSFSKPHLKARALGPVVQQILEVLVGNAEAHGGGAVTVTAREHGSWVRLDISDEGPGFDGDPEHAFRRGTGTDHGIGLALARSLADAEGGRVYVSHPGSEPVVTLMLPAAD